MTYSYTAEKAKKYLAKDPNAKSNVVLRRAEEHGLEFARDIMGYSFFTDDMQIQVMNLNHAEAFLDWLEGKQTNYKPVQKKIDLNEYDKE